MFLYRITDFLFNIAKQRFSSCLVDSKNGPTFENLIIGIGDIGLNVREHENKKIKKNTKDRFI